MSERRTFIKILGKGTLSTVLGTVLLPSFLGSCGSSPSKNKLSDIDEAALNLTLKGILPSSEDRVVLANGLDYEVLISWNDKITDSDTFGYNNDFTCFIPLDKSNDKSNDGLLWVNHEYTSSLFVAGLAQDQEKKIEHIDKEMYSVGGSIVRIRKENGTWSVVQNDPHNKRITAKTPLAFNWPNPIEGKHTGIGTHSNCSGGITPWGTVLTCEENYDIFYGETIYEADGTKTHSKSRFAWEDFYPYPSEHYGWVVEIDPKTGEGQKHIALGRFAHECCTLVELEDKRIVAYTGDDRNNGYLYKFISSAPSSLKEGTLYVADTQNGKWLSMNYDEQEILQKHFKDQTEVLIRAREAGALLGATPQDRPEDIEIDPIDGKVIIAMTNNHSTANHHGAIMRLEEEDKHDALSFKVNTFKMGGEESGFTCPDNLAFDAIGNLWFTSDMSGSLMNKENGPYMRFKNNGLFVVPRYDSNDGVKAGEVIQLASAPVDAEFTGIWFSPDYESLFLSVQHPGEKSKNLGELTSNWPEGGNSIPKPSVIVISGALLKKINRLDKV